MMAKGYLDHERGCDKSWCDGSQCFECRDDYNTRLAALTSGENSTARGHDRASFGSSLRDSRY